MGGSRFGRVWTDAGGAPKGIPIRPTLLPLAVCHPPPGAPRITIWEGSFNMSTLGPTGPTSAESFEKQSIPSE